MLHSASRIPRISAASLAGLAFLSRHISQELSAGRGTVVQVQTWMDVSAYLLDTIHSEKRKRSTRQGTQGSWMGGCKDQFQRIPSEQQKSKTDKRNWQCSKNGRLPMYGCILPSRASTSVSRLGCNRQSHVVKNEIALKRKLMKLGPVCQPALTDEARVPARRARLIALELSPQVLVSWLPSSGQRSAPPPCRTSMTPFGGLRRHPACLIKQSNNHEER